MKSEIKENKILPSPTKREKDVQRKPSELEEVETVKHPHREKEENNEQIPREHPHESETPVDTNNSSMSTII